MLQEQQPCTGVQMLSSARLPTEDGAFRLHLYRSDRDGKEHLALVHGDVAGQTDVLTRVHSECFTGDVLGSKRCDCGPQLHTAMRLIAQAERGVIVYLRQEGRGIGLTDKIRAYGLQDVGYDTVDANLKLGRGADEREYTVAAHILKCLGVRSVQLITNNPKKIEGLESTGLRVNRRIHLPAAVNAENVAYLHTKIRRMDHLIGTDDLRLDEELEAWLHRRTPYGRPSVTLAYTQGPDGTVAAASHEREAAELTHRLRRWHDGVLVGIGTVLSDDPPLTARSPDGPQPIVLDTHLRLPHDARLLEHPHPAWIMSAARRAPDALDGRVHVLPVPAGPHGLNLAKTLEILHQRGIRRLLVEGGTRVLRAFLAEGLADAIVVTIVARFGTRTGAHFPLPHLRDTLWLPSGDDMVMCAAPDWTASAPL